MENSIVIIPTYNEKENIEAIIRVTFEQSEECHVLIVDDSSPDGTIDIVKGLQEEFPDRLHLEVRPGKQGLGTAYIHGFRYALDKGYEYIFEMDADFSHNPKDLKKLYHAVAVNKADVAVGSRYKNGVNVINWPMSRVLLSFFASKYVRFITGIPVNDTTAGFKCYHRRVLYKLNLDKIKFIGYAFQIEMKFNAWRSGFNIEEVPIVFTERTKGKSKMSANIVREALLGVIEMKVKSFFTHPAEL